MEEKSKEEKKIYDEKKKNGIIDEEEKKKLRNEEIDEEMREMESRKSVEMIMKSRILSEELERIIEMKMKDGGGKEGLLKKI
jgi:hypothetical protein